MNDNNISLEVYSSGVVRLLDPLFTSTRVSNLRFGTGYPGGLYLDANFWIPGDPQAFTALNGGQRVVLRNSRRQVYEGYISSVDRIISEGEMGYLVTTVGPWAHILMNRRCKKLWADTRLDDTAWALDVDYSNFDPLRWNILRDEKAMRICALADTEYTYTSAAVFDSGSIIYTAPTGTTIKRITFDYIYDQQGGGITDFDANIMEYTGAWAVLQAFAAAAAGAVYDLTPSANCTRLRFSYFAGSTKTPTHEGENHLIISKCCVYSETGTIDLPAVAGDVVGILTDINSTTLHIDAMGTSRNLVGTPSVAFGDANLPSSFGAFVYESYADILLRAAGFGDGLNNTWTVSTMPSEFAPVYDGKPCLKVEMYPVTTAHDYAIRADEPNVVGTIDIKEDYDGTKNYIIVAYQDDQNRQKFITPEDDATLKDTASIARWGTREAVIGVGYASLELATDAGKRYLARYKDPPVLLTQPLQVIGAIRSNLGDLVPVSEVEAGKRICVENWMSDVTGMGSEATFVITSTDYNDESQTVSITTGAPPDLIFPVSVRTPVIINQDNRRYRRAADPVKGGQSGLAPGAPSGGGKKSP